MCVTTYSYSGNQTTVTDPAGNWKQYTTDAQGNLTSVVEPDPANKPGGTLTTSYTYDWMNHVTGGDAAGDRSVGATRFRAAYTYYLNPAHSGLPRCRQALC